MTMTLAERIESKVNRSGGSAACHPWVGGFGQYGTPSIWMRRDGKSGSASARKVAWELENGPVPDEHVVLVSCGDRSCMNTEHMFLKSNRLEDLFWSHVEKTDGCWLWTGSTIQTGYGQLFHHGKHYPAHRLSYELHIGKIEGHVPGHPEREICVLHRCDEPRCVKPEHLFLGNDADNMADMHAKGRGAGGPNASGMSRQPKSAPRRPNFRPRFTGTRDRRTVLHFAQGDRPACAVGANHAPRVTHDVSQVTCKRCRIATPLESPSEEQKK